MKKQAITLDIKRVNGKIHRAISNHLRNMDMPVTPVQGRLLMYISEHDDVTATDILDNLKSVNKSTLSEILNGMEKNDYIRREESKNDSRKKIIRLTDSAKEIVQSMEKDFDFINKMVLENISQEELDAFKKVLAKIEENLERI